MNKDKAELATYFVRAVKQRIIGGDLQDQLAHCAGWSRVLLDLDLVKGRAIDIGTGGGLPGLALAYWLEELHWTLVDRRDGRIQEVQRSIYKAGLESRVQALSAGVEELGHDEGFREHFDLVVARSFGPPAATAEGAAGLVKVGGAVVVSAPPKNKASDWPAESLAALGLKEPELHVDEESGAGFLYFAKEAPLSSSLPRRSAKFGKGWPKAAQ